MPAVLDLDLDAEVTAGTGALPGVHRAIDRTLRWTHLDAGTGADMAAGEEGAWGWL